MRFCECIAVLTSVRFRIFIFTMLLSWLVSCQSPISRDSVIDRYKAAVCLPPSKTLNIQPRAREWASALTLSNGNKVIVTGAQIPGGQVQVYFVSTGESFVAIDPGDYIYPAELRINAANNILYLKASGLAGGIQEQTWMFEYDLCRQRLIARVKVSNGLLPTDCVESTVQPGH